MLVRKKALEEVSEFDERYFFFFEETDLAYSLRQKGWQVYHVADAFIYHLQGQSIGVNVRSRIEFYRSRYQFLKKWYSRPYYWLARAIIFLRLILDFTIKMLAAIVMLGLAKNIRKKAKVYFELICWHIKN